MNDEIQIQRDDLKQLNNTKDKFFSIIAHDLKNPFNSIKGFTELMIENIESYNKEKKLKFLKIIKGSTVKASDLLNNLLIWATTQSGDLKFHPQKIELVNQVSNAISLLEIQAVNKEIKIVNHVKFNVFVNADANMLDTILRNLISNAIKFTNQSGEVRVESKVKEDFVEISVEDNGIGLSESDIKDLFNINVKNSNLGTANEQGSGLGLILCHDFVKKNGGKIWVDSILGTGSSFKFTLPVWKD
jgi:signal transduction histidine kinase